MNKREKLLDLRQEIEKLSNNIEVLKTRLGDLNSIIQADGFIPSEVNSATVNLLQEIEGLNNSCIENLKAIDNNIALPETITGLSRVVSNYIETDDEIQQFEALRTEISKLKTNNDTIVEALTSIQQELKIINVDGLSSDTIHSLIVKYQTLRDAILEQDAGKRLSFMMELKNSFDAETLITLLASGGVFSINEAPDEEDITDEDKNKEILHIKKEQTDETEKSNENLETENTPLENSFDKSAEFNNDESKETYSAPEKEDIAIDDEEDPNPDEFETALFNSLKECGGLVPQSDDFRVFETPKANKEFQRKKFQNDISECGDFAKNILNRCVNTGVVTPKMFLTGDSDRVVEVTNAIKKLYEKGYLRLYDIPELGSFYGPSNRTWKASANQGVRSYIGIQSSTESLKNYYSASGRNWLITLLLISRAYETVSKHYAFYSSQTGFIDNSFVALFIERISGENNSLIFTTLITDNKEGLVEYIDALVDTFDEIEGDVVICGVNHSQAEALADTLEKEISEIFKDREVFLYDCISDTISSYDTGEEAIPPFFLKTVSLNAAAVEETFERTENEEIKDFSEAVTEDNNEKKQGLSRKENSFVDPQDNTSSKEGSEEDLEKKEENMPDNEGDIESIKNENLIDGDNSSYGLNNCASPAEYASKLLDLCKSNQREATDEEIEKLVLFLLKDGKRIIQGTTVADHLTQAFYLAKSVPKEDYPKTNRLYRQLRTAIVFPGEEEQYSGTALNDLFNGESERGVIAVAAYMISLFASETAHDYTLITQARDILENNSEYFDGLEEVKSVMHLLCELRASKAVKSGFTTAMVLSLDDTKGREAQIQALGDTAHGLQDEPTIKIKLNGLLELKHSLFGSNSILRKGIDIVANNCVSKIADVKNIIDEYAYTGADGIVLKTSSIDKLIDREWIKATKGYRTHGMPLRLMGRQLVIEEIEKRLVVMNQWVNIIENQNAIIPKEIRVARETLQRKIPQIRANINSVSNSFGGMVLDRALEFMEDRLKGEDRRKNTCLTVDFLRTGYISLDQSFIPIFDNTYNKVRYFELWRSMLHHIAAPVEDLLEVRSKIKTEETSELFDNFEQCVLIERYLEMIGRPVEKTEVDDYDITEAKKNAEKSISMFKAKLELAYAYNQLFESDKEDIQYLIEEHQDTFFDQMNFGSVRRFVHALDDYESELANSRRNELEANLNHLFEQAKAEGETRTELLEEAARLLSDPSQRYGLAEEYLNRFEVGERKITPNLEIEEQNGSFQDFISDDVFLELFRLCENEKGMAMSSPKSTIAGYVRKKVPGTWGANEKKRSEELLNCWPSKAGMTKPERMSTLFELLSFDVERADRQMQDRRMELWRLYCKPAEKNVSDYRHPIASFGTRMPEYINVLCIFGTETARSLVEKVCGKNLGGITIVLLDTACRRSVRREIAEYFHTTKTGRNPFLLVDRVLFLYLVLHEPSSRLPLLLKCTLPYTIYQPFTSGKGPTPDEMFFGRSRELNTIISPDGANFVYGGRQLGKTALLERAENLVNRPEKREYAVHVSVIDKDSVEAFTSELIHEINKKTNLKIKSHKDLNGLCDEFSERFRNKEISKVLLLIDEADAFLASIKNDSYKAIQPLVNLMRETGNRFKFVLAGLHNVFRARKAIAENGIFGQLGTPLCVKPLSPGEAYGLVTQPLRYLGFSTDQTSYLETILTNTNYFPGILQFFGYTLVANVHSEYIRYYSKDKNPPFNLQEQMLGDIMNSTDLNDSIRQRLCATLDLDARYFAIARCIAMLYFLGPADELRRGYTIEEMIETAKDFYIMRLEGMNENEFATLLEELQNMGIVIKNEKENRYRFRRRAFINIICKDNLEQLEKDINYDNEVFLA